jgi:hypothetical protein
MGEIVPGVAVIAVVLADRTALPLAQVGSPFLPGDLRLARLVQPFLLGDIDTLSGHFSPPPSSQYSGGGARPNPVETAFHLDLADRKKQFIEASRVCGKALRSTAHQARFGAPIDGDFGELLERLRDAELIEKAAHRDRKAPL